MLMVFQESRIKLFDHWLETNSEEEERCPVSDMEMVQRIETWMFGRDTVFEQEYIFLWTYILQVFMTHSSRHSQCISGNSVLSFNDQYIECLWMLDCCFMLDSYNWEIIKCSLTQDSLQF